MVWLPKRGRGPRERHRTWLKSRLLGRLSRPRRGLGAAWRKISRTACTSWAGNRRATATRARWWPLWRLVWALKNGMGRVKVVIFHSVSPVGMGKPRETNGNRHENATTHVRSHTRASCEVRPEGSNGHRLELMSMSGVDDVLVMLCSLALVTFDGLLGLVDSEPFKSERTEAPELEPSPAVASSQSGAAALTNCC